MQDANTTSKKYQSCIKVMLPLYLYSYMELVITR